MTSSPSFRRTTRRRAPEDALQLLVFTARYFHIRYLFERQHPREEVHRAVHIGNGHADGLHGFNSLAPSHPASKK
jgi:hypothetical protein